MKLIKLTNEHYIICDDSQIKEGDYYISWMSGRILKRTKTMDIVEVMDKKITHSNIGHLYQDSILPLSLKEVKELIGEVDVEKKALAINPIELIQGWDKKKEYRENWISGYNQAIEDNREKKYTDTDLFKILLDFIEFQHPHHEPRGSIIERFVKTRQPKTEWEVDFFDGKLGFKK